MTVKYDDHDGVVCYWMNSRGYIESEIIPREMLELGKPKEAKDVPEAKDSTVEDITETQKTNAVLEGIHRMNFNDDLMQWATRIGNTVILVEWLSTEEYRVTELQVLRTCAVDAKGHNK